MQNCYRRCRAPRLGEQQRRSSRGSHGTRSRHPGDDAGRGTAMLTLQAQGQEEPQGRARLTTDSQKRKETPLASGCLDYFPNALAAIAELSFIGNQKHNPGQPLHWARDKSTDEADCLIRHFLERGTLDTDGIRHSVKVAWRALAMVQRELEEAGGLPISRGSRGD